MKKISTLVLMLMCAIATWAHDFEVDGIYYNILQDKTNEVEVTYQYEWSSDNYAGLTAASIPSTVTYNGTTYGVTSIGREAFANCSGLTLPGNFSMSSRIKLGLPWGCSWAFFS